MGASLGGVATVNGAKVTVITVHRPEKACSIRAVARVQCTKVVVIADLVVMRNVARQWITDIVGARVGIADALGFKNTFPVRRTTAINRARVVVVATLGCIDASDPGVARVVRTQVPIAAVGRGILARTGQLVTDVIGAGIQVPAIPGLVLALA
jgi:acetyl-CoA carboxylase carboxyltransferase component